MQDELYLNWLIRLVLALRSWILFFMLKNKKPFDFIIIVGADNNSARIICRMNQIHNATLALGENKFLGTKNITLLVRKGQFPAASIMTNFVMIGRWWPVSRQTFSTPIHHFLFSLWHSKHLFIAQFKSRWLKNSYVWMLPGTEQITMAKTNHSSRSALYLDL